jgi:hypothetical protein
MRLGLGLALSKGAFLLIGLVTYLRPDGVSKYKRPDGSSTYIRP